MRDVRAPSIPAGRERSAGDGGVRFRDASCGKDITAACNALWFATVFALVLLTLSQSGLHPAELKGVLSIAHAAGSNFVAGLCFRYVAGLTLLP